jgi:hypothetical protein
MVVADGCWAEEPSSAPPRTLGPGAGLNSGHLAHHNEMRTEANLAGGSGQDNRHFRRAIPQICISR